MNEEEDARVGVDEGCGRGGRAALREGDLLSVTEAERATEAGQEWSPFDGEQDILAAFAFVRLYMSMYADPPLSAPPNALCIAPSLSSVTC